MLAYTSLTTICSVRPAPATAVAKSVPSNIESTTGFCALIVSELCAAFHPSMPPAEEGWRAVGSVVVTLNEILFEPVTYTSLLRA